MHLKLVTAVVALVAWAAVVCVPPVSASEPPTPRDFPSVMRVAKVFPQVSSRELDTVRAGNPAFLPHCALDGVDDLAADAPEARLGFWAAYANSKRRGVGAIAESFRFANRAEAARSMRVAKKVLRRCSGLQIGDESYSRYRRFTIPALGDDRVGYVGGYEYDFEPGYRGSRVILSRVGRNIVVVEGRRFDRRGSKPTGARSTVAFARLVLKRNPLF